MGIEDSKKIKYVAIGDSISEGYSEYFQFGLPGELVNDEVTGTSWPSYFARYIQKAFPNKLLSYYNFALTSSRAEEWNYFFQSNPNFDTYSKSKKKLEYIKLLNDNEVNPYKSRIENYFDNFDDSKKDKYQFVINNIKNANLITINIGANSAFTKIPFSHLLNNLINSNPDNVNELKEKIDHSIENIRNEINKLFSRLRTINKIASIYTIGYVLPFNQTFNLINKKYIYFEQKTNESICVYYIKKLNFLLKEESLKNNINFVDVFDSKFWNKYSQYLSEVFYDIHPSIKGYKKIAQDVFNNVFNLDLDKVSFSDNQLLNLFKNEDKNKKENFDKQVLKIVNEENKKLFETDKYEREANKLKQMFFVEKSFLNKEFINNTINEFNKSIFSVLKIYDVNLTVSQQKKLGILLNEKKFIKNILESKTISKIFWDIQQDLNKKNNNVSNLEFQKILFSRFVDFNNVFSIAKQIINSFNKVSDIEDFLSIIYNFIIAFYRKKEFKKIIFNLFLIACEKIFKKIDIKLSIATKRNILKYLFEHIDFEKTILNIKEFIIKNVDQIKTISKPDKLLQLYFKENKNIAKFIEVSNNLFIQNLNFKKQIINFIFKKIELYDIESNEKLIITEFIDEIIKLINKNKLIKKITFEFISTNFLSNKKTKLQDIFDFLLNLDKKNYWHKLKEIDKEKVSQNSRIIDLFVSATEIIFKQEKFNKLLFKKLNNLSNPKMILNKNKTVNIIRLFVTLEKTLYLTNLMHALFDYLYNKYEETKESYLDINNKYYKCIFRITLLLLFTTYKLFQTNLNKNIFWTKNISFKISPSIVASIYRFFINKKELNTNKAEFFLDLFGEKNNSFLVNKYTENKYNKNQVLCYLSSHESHPTDLFTKKPKLDIIFESISKGFWILTNKNKAKK